METLLDVMREARRLAEGDDRLLAEVDAHIADLRAGRGDARAMEVLFLPTAHDDALLSLADRFDVAACAHRGHAVHCCRVCGKPAGTLVVEGNELRRERVTSVLTQRVTAAVRAALGDAAVLYDRDSRRSSVPPARRLTAGNTGVPTTSSRTGYTIRSVAHARSVTTGCWKIRLRRQQMTMSSA
jgi:hypothetical protein